MGTCLSQNPARVSGIQCTMIFMASHRITSQALLQLPSAALRTGVEVHVLCTRLFAIIIYSRIHKKELAINSQRNHNVCTHIQRDELENKSLKKLQCVQYHSRSSERGRALPLSHACLKNTRTQLQCTKIAHSILQLTCPAAPELCCPSSNQIRQGISISCYMDHIQGS